MAQAQAQVHWENPMGTDGFAFLEFSSPDGDYMKNLFTNMGFVQVATHKRKKGVTLFRQGNINFVLNMEPGSQATEFAKTHGASANAMGFVVKNAKEVYEKLLAMGAEPFKAERTEGEADMPAIMGIGGAVVYLVDRPTGDNSVFEQDFAFAAADKFPKGVGLTYLDHVTHNVFRGNMNKWAGFYEKFFNFREVRYFDIEGKLTGLVSRAMTSPCGKIRIPINESSDDRSQIEEFLKDFNGEGIQHIALGTDDIYATVEALKQHDVNFLNTPDTYYEKVDTRVPQHGEDLTRLHKNKILVDGAPTEGQGLLLQIFTETVMGPVFFEIIQRKGNEGFGEGNFKALFESIEEDQVRRGVLQA